MTELKQTFRREDKKDSSSEGDRTSYQVFVRLMLKKGVDWEVRWVNKSGKNIKWEKFNEKCDDALDVTEVPKFENMMENVLYCPMDPNFPAIDLMFKKENKLLAIQVTRQSSLSKEFKVGAFENFLKIVGMEFESFERKVIFPFRTVRSVQSKQTFCFNRKILIQT